MFEVTMEGQESLPQEALDALLNILNADGQFFREMFPAPVPMQSARSSLPATSDWPGDYDFNVTFTQTDKNIHWIYSETECKLYIGKNVPCPINFSVSVPMLPGALVRAMAVFTSPEHANESVHRCVDHSVRDIEANVFEAEHLIRSDCLGAEYVQHKDSKRHSVTVPFENPPAGQCFSTYIYKFACLGSCSGGPNRRPITLVFTLEQNNMVIGRRSINLRVCANPGRDSGVQTKKAPVAKRMKTDSQQHDQPSLVKPLTCFNPGRDSGAQTKKAPMAKKMKTDCQQQVTVPTRKIEDTYTVQTRDPECYRFLQSMKKTYERDPECYRYLQRTKKMYKIQRNVNSYPRDAIILISKLVNSSEDDFSSDN